MSDPAKPTPPIAAPGSGADGKPSTAPVAKPAVGARPGMPVAASATAPAGTSGAPSAARPSEPRVPEVSRPSPGRPASRSAGVVLTALALALLVGGLAWVWSQQQQFAETTDVAALREQLRTLQQRLTQVEQRPAAVPAVVPTSVPAVVPAAVDLRPLEARLAALEQRPAAIAADPGIADRLAALDQRVLQAERAGVRSVRLARLQRAAAALESGQALGEIPGAPAALARFAFTAPPTESALRLGFPAAAQRARAASQIPGGEPGIGERIWHRMLNLVTVRAGDTVLVGTPAAIGLGQAAERLGGGDLAGAVAALDALDAAASAAIADWRASAASLLAARAALATMLVD